MLCRLKSDLQLKENLRDVQIIVSTRLLDRNLLNWDAFATGPSTRA